MKTNQTWLPVLLIAGALLSWMALLAAGAYWAPVGGSDGDTTGGSGAEGDYRKLWVVAATTGGFLLMWGMVLWRYAAKARKQRR